MRRITICTAATRATRYENTSAESELRLFLNINPRLLHSIPDVYTIAAEAMLDDHVKTRITVLASGGVRTLDV